MNKLSGVRVFRSSTGTPTILAYAFLTFDYMTCVYRTDKLYIGKLSFSTLLDIIPICSLSLFTYLPFGKNLNETLQIWCKNIKQSLINYGKMYTVNCTFPKIYKIHHLNKKEFDQ